MHVLSSLARVRLGENASSSHYPHGFEELEAALELHSKPS
jgi:hypothetical protein